jgi:hypothetical protein
MNIGIKEITVTLTAVKVGIVIVQYVFQIMNSRTNRGLRKKKQNLMQKNEYKLLLHVIDSVLKYLKY